MNNSLPSVVEGTEEQKTKYRFGSHPVLRVYEQNGMGAPLAHPIKLIPRRKSYNNYKP